MTKIKKSIHNKKVGDDQPNWAIIIGVSITIFMMGVGMFIINTTPNSSSMTEPLTMAEAQLLYDRTCANCHGKQGEGHIQFNAPALNSSEHAWHHSDKQIINIIRNGGEQMPAMGTLFSDREVDGVITYLKSWWTATQKVSQQGTIGE